MEGLDLGGVLHFFLFSLMSQFYAILCCLLLQSFSCTILIWFSFSLFEFMSIYEATATLSA